MVQQVSRGGDTNRLSTAFVREHDQAVQARRLRGSEPFGCAAAAAAPLAFEPAGESLGLPTRARVEGASAAAQEAAERTAFEAWLASVHGGCRADALSPFEHNLEVWRQLWRVVERSDVVCIVADVRNPLLHVPAALYEHCAARPSLRLVIVLSKVDLISREALERWREALSRRFPRARLATFSSKGREVGGSLGGGVASRRKALGAPLSAAGRRTVREYVEGVAEACGVRDTVTVGFVGHPNVGKTSLLNALVGRKVASVSRTPGHTKHLQTWELTPRLTICDSPGLVFPVAGVRVHGVDASARAVYECCGLFPIAQVREALSAVRLLWHALDLPRMYNLRPAELDDDEDELSPFGFCAALAERKGYRLARGRGALDIHRAGLEVLKDCVDGAVCLAFAPPAPAAAAPDPRPTG
ncbi:hypothetical protein EMIHUDRAFT_242840 [Emiliania huxleyi CCMP1516]|uniref:Guanine nucleotide-binding protein-like 1 n=2 Tax=Emiliania huxleyi TaxID=2903 RepID=A0A0D3J7C2_EMIH1|nr:hypothetical protein EMIHUDRAFT_242840 [Emiliania huxleyi CCMP1516]EOD19407.1 hypothetical protein EMIHUDRAFT_242840 [Emiliania huxleyi CCMP1516]|eukprot:XP_005771836.1 hypothetical protein EMIHUDRAFT_242840 [Emiliania huxleyi CCMP1516]